MSQEKFKSSKSLYEPVAPYFVNTYNTLISVVQGLALAALLYIINDIIFIKNGLNFYVILKLIVAFLTINLIWNRYATHNLYLAWHIGAFDTIIPMVFAILQIIFILSIPKNIFYFSLFLTIISGWGVIAYINSAYRHDCRETEDLYKEHFACCTEDFSSDIYWEIKGFEKEKVIEMIIITIVYSSIPIAIHYTNFSDNTYTIGSFILYTLAYIYLFQKDLKKRRNRSKKLEKYNYRW